MEIYDEKRIDILDTYSRSTRSNISFFFSVHLLHRTCLVSQIFPRWKKKKTEEKYNREKKSRRNEKTIEEFFSSCWSEDRTIERLSPRKESEKEAKWEMARETVKNKGKKGRTEIHRWLEGRERKARINSPPRVNSCRDETQAIAATRVLNWNECDATRHFSIRFDIYTHVRSNCSRFSNFFSFLFFYSFLMHDSKENISVEYIG